MKMSRIRQIIKEELEVILTNQEVGDLFGKAVQAKLEEGWPAGAERDEAAEEEGEAESAAALAGGAKADYAASAATPTLEGHDEDASGVHGETIANQIQHLLDTEELSPENRAFYENFLSKHIEQTKLAVAKRVGVDEPEEGRLPRVTGKSIAALKRRTGIGQGSPRGAASRHKTSQFDR